MSKAAADYQRGYAAGRRISERSNWNKAFLAVLPAAMLAKGWTISKVAVQGTSSRITLAKVWADKAVKEMK